jgi:hypothetical protein
MLPSLQLELTIMLPLRTKIPPKPGGKLVEVIITHNGFQTETDFTKALPLPFRINSLYSPLSARLFKSEVWREYHAPRRGKELPPTSLLHILPGLPDLVKDGIWTIPLSLHFQRHGDVEATTPQQHNP